MKRMCLRFLSMKTWKIITWIVFIPIDGWTLILKMVGNEVFLMKPKHQFIYPNKKMSLWSQSWKERRLLHDVFTTFDRRTLILKNGGKWSFSYEMKASIHLSQQVKWTYGAQSLKERRLVCESMIIPIKGRTLIPNLIEREVFLSKPKHQYHLYQWGECALWCPFMKRKEIIIWI